MPFWSLASADTVSRNRHWRSRTLLTEIVLQSFATLEAFFLAMALHPDVQARARAELDAIVGPHRLPDYSDREQLVYINAIMKESLRWHNTFPLAISHRTIADATLRGYFIPAGTTVIPNVWSVPSLSAHLMTR